MNNTKPSCGSVAASKVFHISKVNNPVYLPFSNIYLLNISGTTVVLHHDEVQHENSSAFGYSIGIFHYICDVVIMWRPTFQRMESFG